MPPRIARQRAFPMSARALRQSPVTAALTAASISDWSAQTSVPSLDERGRYSEDSRVDAISNSVGQLGPAGPMADGEAPGRPDGGRKWRRLWVWRGMDGFYTAAPWRALRRR